MELSGRLGPGETLPELEPLCNRVATGGLVQPGVIAPRLTCANLSPGENHNRQHWQHSPSTSYAFSMSIPVTHEGDVIAWLFFTDEKGLHFPRLT